jgi:ABC-2 type transport system permease protein
MNIFKYELSSNLKTAVIWTIVMMMLVTVVLSFYPMLNEDISMIVNMLENYPEPIRNAFGFNIEVLDTILGFFASMPMSFLLICGTLEAMLLGVTIISKEEREKTADFLFTKPISRTKIFISKFTTAIFLLFTSTTIVFTFSYFLLLMLGSKPININLFLLLYGAIIILQLFFVALGFFVSIASKKIKSPLTISLAVVFGLYAFNSFIEDKMRLLIPYKYLNINYITKNISYEIEYVILLIIIIVLLIFSSIRMYVKKDIQTI